MLACCLEVHILQTNKSKIYIFSLGNSRQIMLLKLSSKSVMMSKTKPFLHGMKKDEVNGHRFLECKTSASLSRSISYGIMLILTEAILISFLICGMVFKVGMK